MRSSKNYFNLILSSRNSYLLLAAIGLLYATTLSFNSPRTDDDILGEQVYWLDQLGYVKSELMRGYNDIEIEKVQTLFHKLFIYQALVFVKIFGWSLPVLHSVSLFYSLIFFVIIYFFLKSKFSYYKSLFLFIVCATLLHHNFLWFSCGFRPEVMQMTLGFLSYIFLDKFLEKNNSFYLILAGVFAGLDFLTHLNGLIFIAAGGILLLANKKYYQAIIFGVISALVFSIFFLDIFYFSSLEFFWFQFKNDPSLNKSNFSLLSPMWKLFDEPMRFFHSEKEIIYSVPVFLSLIFAFRYLKTKHRNLMIYTLALVLILGSYTYSKTSKYLLLYLPFLMLIMAEGWKYMEEEGEYVRKLILRSCLLIYFGYSIVLTSIRIKENLNIGSISVFNHEINKDIGRGNEKILAPSSYIFNEIKSGHQILSLSRFSFYTESHGLKKISFSQLLDSANFYKRDYVILDGYHSEHFNVTHELETQDKRYSLISKHGDYIVLKLRKADQEVYHSNDVLNNSNL
jgi:hypothetical protein